MLIVNNNVMIGRRMKSAGKFIALSIGLSLIVVSGKSARHLAHIAWLAIRFPAGYDSHLAIAKVSGIS
jgi:hypothetical protein